MRLLISLILAHVSGSYCGVIFYGFDNYGCTYPGFGGWKAPIFILPDYISYTWSNWRSDGLFISMYWSEYLVPFALVLLAGQLVGRRREGRTGFPVEPGK